MSAAGPEVFARGLSGPAFEALPVAALVVERATAVIELANRAAERLFVRTAGHEGSIDGVALERFTFADRAALVDDLRVAAGGGAQLMVLRTRVGQRFTCSYRVSSITAADDRWWLVVIQRDRPSLAQLSELNERVREADEQASRERAYRRTLERTNAQLQLTQRELRRVNDDLEHFSHIASHDLRAPCRRQVMLAGLLVDDLRDQAGGTEERPEVKKLRMILEQGEAMLAMIDGFRELATLAGSSVDSSVLDLQASVSELVAELVPPGADVVASVELPSGVRGYATLVEILFRNLIGNALKHGTRPLTLDIGFDQIERDGTPSVVFHVTNSANPRSEPRCDLFKPFVRGATSAPGSGLGLSICQRVVQRHQGRIWIDNTDDRFSVRFTLGSS